MGRRYAAATATFRPAPRGRRRELVEDPDTARVVRGHFVAASGVVRVLAAQTGGGSGARDAEPLAELAFATALFSGPLPCARLRLALADPPDGCGGARGGGGGAGGGDGGGGALVAPHAASVVARGGCFFHVKARVAQDRGAAALVVVNSDAAPPSRMPRGGDSDGGPLRDLCVRACAHGLRVWAADLTGANPYAARD